MKLSGKTYAQVVDSVGKWYSDYQKYLLSKMQTNHITIYSTNVQSFCKTTSQQFVATHGITPENTTNENIDLADTTWDYTGYSSSAQSILNKLRTQINNYTIENHSYFITQCNALKTFALNLPIDKEALVVGSVVSVAINSAKYWKDNLDPWLWYLTENTSRSINTYSYLRWKEVVGTDAAGAWRGAASGAEWGAEFGGLHGAVSGGVAGGIIGGAFASASDAIWQAAQHSDGPIGRVSRWISDWF